LVSEQGKFSCEEKDSKEKKEGAGGTIAKVWRFYGLTVVQRNGKGR